MSSQEPALPSLFWNGGVAAVAVTRLCLVGNVRTQSVPDAVLLSRTNSLMTRVRWNAAVEASSGELNAPVMICPAPLTAAATEGTADTKSGVLTPVFE